MKKRKYLKPIIDIVPYSDSIMETIALGSMGVEEGGMLSKEYDFEDNNEEGFDNDFWQDERKDFGLEEWTDEW